MKSFLVLLISLALFNPLFSWDSNDALTIKEIGKIAPSPQANFVAYEALTAKISLDKGYWETKVYLTECQNKKTTVLPWQDYISGSLVWSPDSQSIYFLSKLKKSTQLYRYNILKSSSDLIFESEMALTAVFPSPDNKSLALTLVKTLPTSPHFEVVDEHLSKSELHLLDLTTLLTQPLVTEYSVGSVSWSPHSQFLAFDYQPSTQVEAKILHSQCGYLNLSDKSFTVFGNTNASNYNPMWSHNGHYIAFTTSSSSWDFASYASVYNPLTEHTKKLSDTPDEQIELIGWREDDQSLLVSERYHEAQRIYALTSKGECLSVTPASEIILQPKLSRDTLFYRYENASQPCEVFLSPLSTFTPQRLSYIQPASYPQVTTQLISWISYDGTPIEGLLTLPSSPGPHPLITLIRGHSSLFINTYEGGFHLSKTPYSLAVFADQGFAVLRPFVRGGSGYGRVQRDSIVGDWGGKDFEDLMSGIDYLISKNWADPDRLGIMGWSYGGFMSANSIGKTSRFKAASVGGALINFVSYSGTTDIPSFLPHYMQGWYWENPSGYHTHSPIEKAHLINTPTLIQHSSGDKRVLSSQSRELYTALRQRNIPTKLILYHDKGHSFSNPLLMKQALDHNLDWFNKHLKASEL